MNEILEISPLIPICSNLDPEDAVTLAKCYIDAGLKNMEITLRSDTALNSIKAVKDALPDMIVGAGTVFTAEQAYACFEAGVSYVVSPGYSKEVHRVCEDHALPYLPGAITPTEVQNAQAQGIKTLKFFPAVAANGIQILESYKSVFSDINFCATGGVTLENVEMYLSLGNVPAVGLSDLMPKDKIRDKDWGDITNMISVLLSQLRVKSLIQS